jgi:hypothetical protein
MVTLLCVSGPVVRQNIMVVGVAEAVHLTVDKKQRGWKRSGTR